MGSLGEGRVECLLLQVKLVLNTAVPIQMVELGSLWAKQSAVVVFLRRFG